MGRRMRALLVDLLSHLHSQHINHLKEKEKEEQLLSLSPGSQVPLTAKLKDA